MKSKSTKNSEKKNPLKPFFNKNGKRGYFSPQNENQERPFFKPSKSRPKTEAIFGKSDTESVKPDGENCVAIENPKYQDSENTTSSLNNGIIPDINTPVTLSNSKGIGEIKEDAPSPNQKGNVISDINLTFKQPKITHSTYGKLDPVNSRVTVGSFSQPGGRTVNPFGEEFFEPAFKNIKYKFKDSKCIIKGDLDVICPFGTNSGGKTDIPSGTSSVITKGNWSDIKDDLQPSTTSPFKSPRKKFYSQALVERHEKFHGTDDLGWVQSSGLGIAKAVLESGNISSSNASKEVPELIKKARKTLLIENFKWYKGGGTSHGSFAGEIRAYADGKSRYQKLADDVEKHGKSLK